MVCADTYFASVGAAEELKCIGLCFIGVVKSATNRYPRTYLTNQELQVQGDRLGLVARDDNSALWLLSFV
jgi:hypothetical protein